MTDKQKQKVAATTHRTAKAIVSARTLVDHKFHPADWELPILTVQRLKFAAGVGCTGPDGYYTYCETLADFDKVFACSPEHREKVVLVFADQTPGQTSTGWQGLPELMP